MEPDFQNYVKELLYVARMTCFITQIVMSLKSYNIKLKLKIVNRKIITYLQ